MNNTLNTEQIFNDINHDFIKLYNAANSDNNDIENILECSLLGTPAVHRTFIAVCVCVCVCVSADISLNCAKHD